MSSEQTPHQPATSSETTISAATRKRLQQCFERARQLAHQDKPDYDYAHDLYAQCVVKDPGNLVYVEAMLENLQRKHKQKRGSRLLGFGGKKAFQKAVEGEDWPEAVRLGLQHLRSNPWDVPALRGLARVCEANHHNEVELRYLKNALDAKPKDPEVNRHCARSLARMGQFDQAIACWHRVEDLTKDPEAARMISELTVAKTMGVAPSDAATGTRQSPATPGSAPPPAGEHAASEASKNQEQANGAQVAEEEEAERRPPIELNERQRLERALRTDPTDLDSYLKLAELHTAAHRYHEAEKVLTKALAVSGQAIRVRMLLEDAQIRSAMARLAIAEKRATRDASDEAQELARRLRQDLNRLETDIYGARCQRHPDVPRYRYELAVRLRRAGNFREAVKYYQDSRRDPHCDLAATLEMGECFQQIKQYGQALQCYQAAIERSSEQDGARRHLALYRGGILAAALNQKELAEKWLSALLAEAPGYKDAAARLDKLKQIRHHT
jgi:tetratricopeptide (TPR) repeat protein